MGIKMTTPTSAIDKLLYKAFEILKNEIMMALSKLGEECVVKIRDRSKEESWIDQTGNLRSSVGYAIYDYGVKQIESAFEVVLNGTNGVSEGQKMISQLGREYSQVFALVVVAGMNYASHVESLESKDVLASAELWAKENVNTRLEKAKNKAIKEINELVV